MGFLNRASSISNLEEPKLDSFVRGFYLFVLLTGMTADNWLWFGLWFLLGLVVYFSFGRKNSVLNERG